MLIGNSARRPSLETIRRIKRALRDALELPDDATLTVTELTCLEEGCAPIETVLGLLRPGAAQLQHKLHKPTAAVAVDDLVQVCKAWGFDVHVAALAPFTQER